MSPPVVALVIETSLVRLLDRNVGFIVWVIKSAADSSEHGFTCTIDSERVNVSGRNGGRVII